MLLNIGCKSGAYPDWLNPDIALRHPIAVACDLRHGLPLSADETESCNSSRRIERSKRYEASALIAKQFLVASPSGRMWMVGPYESGIPRFAIVTLDAPAADISPRKPNSQYVEPIEAAS